jgi:hypothetical protein
MGSIRAGVHHLTIISMFKAGYIDAAFPVNTQSPHEESAAETPLDHEVRQEFSKFIDAYDFPGVSSFGRDHGDTAPTPAFTHAVPKVTRLPMHRRLPRPLLPVPAADCFLPIELF